jgi:polysaccharide deacetylase family protein (PEP-CTERM system associated)
LEISATGTPPGSAPDVLVAVGVDRWSALPSRLEDQVLRILELLDSKNTKATFFILGWVAERQPRAVRSIVAAGHEIGCHSYAHQLAYSLTPEEFLADTRRAVATIQDACGISPRSYRAPSYSITAKSFWAPEILTGEGFTQDSSIYPISHHRYGIPGFNRHSHVIQTPSGPIQEIPIATVKLSEDKVMPVGGGGYLRMLPYRYTAAGIRRLNRDEHASTFILGDRRQPAAHCFRADLQAANLYGSEGDASETEPPVDGL